MPQRIAFAGAHSTGKTTTLNAIKGNGWPDIKVDDFRASRSAQAKMGFELADIVKEKKLYHRFQDLTLALKLEHEKQFLDARYSFVLVDRSPADIYAYAYMWHYSDPNLTDEDHKWFHEYEEATIRALSDYDKIINFPIIEEVPFVAESGRATADTRDEHSRRVNGYLALHARAKTHHLKAVSLGERVNEILDVLEWMNA